MCYNALLTEDGLFIKLYKRTQIEINVDFTKDTATSSITSV